MKSLKELKWVKWALGTVGAVVAGGAIMLGGVIIGYPAISQLVGLAVAVSSTTWNNVIDAAKGDTQTSGILGMSPYLWNGTSFDRVKGTGGSMNVAIIGAITPADGYTNPTTAGQMWELPGGFNGTTWDRLRTASGANNSATTSTGALQTTQLSTWNVTTTTIAAVTQTSASKASGGGTVRHVATGGTICYFDSVIAGVSQVNLRDGATGAGTIIRSWLIAVPVANTSVCEELPPMNMIGTAATAMTLEFGAATAATSSKTVTLTGYSTP